MSSALQLLRLLLCSIVPALQRFSSSPPSSIFFLWVEVRRKKPCVTEQIKLLKNYSCRNLKCLNWVICFGLSSHIDSLLYVHIRICGWPVYIFAFQFWTIFLAISLSRPDFYNRACTRPYTFGSIYMYSIPMPWYYITKTVRFLYKPKSSAVSYFFPLYFVGSLRSRSFFPCYFTAAFQFIAFIRNSHFLMCNFRSTLYSYSKVACKQKEGLRWRNDYFTFYSIYRKFSLSLSLRRSQLQRFSFASFAQKKNRPDSFELLEKRQTITNSRVQTFAETVAFASCTVHIYLCLYSYVYFVYIFAVISSRKANDIKKTRRKRKF